MLLPSSPPPHLSKISLKSHLSALFEDDTEKQNHYRFIFFSVDNQKLSTTHSDIKIFFSPYFFSVTSLKEAF